jgi:hypothetical protein
MGVKVFVEMKSPECKKSFICAVAGHRVLSGSMRKSLLLLLSCTTFLGAQSISFGVKGGGLFTQPAERVDQGRKYVVGPVVEIGFGARAAVEANALYSRFGASVSGASVRGHAVEFPVQGKYYFTEKSSAFRPYASGGFVFRNIWFDRERSFRVNGSGRFGSTEPAVGAVFSGGIQFRAAMLKFAPELRYTRWGGYNFPATNPHQLEALVGITF